MQYSSKPNTSRQIKKPIEDADLLLKHEKKTAHPQDAEMESNSADGDEQSNTSSLA